MNAAHLHLLVNHVAVLGVAFGLALGVFGLLLAKHDLVRAALAVFVIAGLATIVTYYSGEGAEEMIEHAAGVSEATLESHEAAGKPAAIASVMLGALALVALVLVRNREPGRGLVAGVLVVALGVTGWNMYVANLGGAIRHPEIHAGWTGDASQQVRQESPRAAEVGVFRAGRGDGDEDEERAE